MKKIKRKRRDQTTNDLEEPGTSGNPSVGRHPKGLKGREIGLWYASRGQGKAKRELTEHEKETRLRHKEAIRRKNQEKIDKKPLGTIILSETKRERIQKVLNETDSMYPTTSLKRTSSYEHLQDTAFKHEFLTHITVNIIDRLRLSKNKYDFKNASLDEYFYEELEIKKKNSEYRKMQEIRKKLPSMDMKYRILELVNENQVVVISGETGCGKTTQVAQFILDDYIENHNGSACKIVCTQPRRISAISVAERVAEERTEKLGESVGFQIRLEKTMSRDRGSILFCTTGVLLKFMEGDPSLGSISHLILDEIHERDVTSDFLITVLTDVIKYRKDLKIILMSATLNAEAFSKYYNNAPHINIPGFTYPVTEYFLEDVIQRTRYSFKESGTPIWVQKMRKTINQNEEWSGYVEPYLRQLEAEKKYDRFVIDELRKQESEKLDINVVYALLKDICKKDKDNGAILVFLTGFAEIQKIQKNMVESGDFPFFKYIILPLHSLLPTVAQKQIFNPAPKGKRKIILSTNIAETSITIDDVTTVIDCGFIKMTNLDVESGFETLKPEWVSCANAGQRRGRAGRVQAGVCYHLITRARYALLDKFQKPEVLRCRLEDVILQLKMLQLGDAGPFLARLMDPPEATSVQNSISLLHRLGALDENESLTPLGLHMAKLPVGAQCAKMLIMAALFSCLDPVLSVAASLGFKDAFLLSSNDPQTADKARIELSAGTYSDHLLMYLAVRGYEEASDKRSFCNRYFLSSQTLRLLQDMRKQFAQLLCQMKFIKNQNPNSLAHNYNSGNLSLVKAVICAGLYPNVAILNRNSKRRILRSTKHEKMEFHPKSILSRIQSIPSPLVVYHLRQKSSSLFVHDGTIVYPLPLVFFGDEFCRKTESDHHSLTINGTMRFLCTENTASIIEKLRDRLNRILEHKVSHPGVVNWESNSPEVQVLRAIMEMITCEDTGDMNLSDYDDY